MRAAARRHGRRRAGAGVQRGRGAGNAGRRRRAVRPQRHGIRCRAARIAGVRRRSAALGDRRSAEAPGRLQRCTDRARTGSGCQRQPGRLRVMKIAFIVQRYGSEVLGGSEHLCRLVAERLAAHHDVEVLTTCARDYVTWKNEYPEGSDRIRGVTVRRFATARTRDLDSFNKYSDWIFANQHTRNDEMEWLKQQGPWCPALIDHLRRQHQQYDILIFFTYLYATTVLGTEVSPGRSILVPTAHDEPAIKLEVFKDLFTRVAALCYLTESEMQFVRRQFPDRPLLEELIGVGVDIPQQQPYPRMPTPPEDDLSIESETNGDAGQTGAAPGSGTEEGPTGAQEPGREGAAKADEEAPVRDFPSHLLAGGSVFRRRHRLYGPIALYGGRIDPGKGCEELIEYFSTYVKEGGDATLALMGV